jgi:3',5'-cyclic AMP phosphodiesterase CpdA
MIIVQITDMHLRPAGDLCHGVADTAPALATAVDRIMKLDPLPDVVLATGDLVDQEGPADYRQLRQYLEPLNMPVYLIPGNHDDRAAMRAEFGGAGYLPTEGEFLHYTVEDYPLRLIGLDTLIPGQESGEICTARRQWLDARLSEAPDKPTIVFMHHPPFGTGIPFMDRQGCAGREALEQVVDRHPQVERVLCGHQHRSVQVAWGGTIAVVAPSTAFQMAFTLKADALSAFFLGPPAALLHLWQPETGVISHALSFADDPGPFRFP